MRKTLAAIAAVFVCLLAAPAAFAMDEPPDGGTPDNCYMNMYGQWRCFP